MSEQTTSSAPPTARVIEVDPADAFELPPVAPPPRVIVTEETERVTPSEPANLPAVVAASRYGAAIAS